MKTRAAAALAALVLLLVGLPAAPAHAAINNVYYSQASGSTSAPLRVTCRGGQTWLIAAPSNTSQFCWDTGWVQAGASNQFLWCYDGSWKSYGKASVSVRDAAITNCRTYIG